VGLRANTLFALAGAALFGLGVMTGGYLFRNVQPRSFLALDRCAHACTRASDLAGLLAAAGIDRAPGWVPLVAKETDKCIAIRHPFPDARYHFVIFPKKDIKSIQDIAEEDEPYVMDCLRVMRSLVIENGLTKYEVFTNGPRLQKVTYLHFHLTAN